MNPEEIKSEIQTACKELHESFPAFSYNQKLEWMVNRLKRSGIESQIDNDTKDLSVEFHDGTGIIVLFNENQRH